MTDKSNIKVFATDLDDTLLHTDLTIAPFDAFMLNKLQQSGVHVVLASGRMCFDIQRTFDKIGLDKTDAYTVGGGGGEVVKVSTSEQLFSKHVSLEAAEIVTKYAKEHNYCAELYFDSTTILGTQTNKHHQYHAWSVNLKDRRVTYEEYLEACKTQRPLKLFIVEDPDIISTKVIPELSQLLPPTERTLITNPFFCEIIPKDGSKSVGLSWLSENVYKCTMANVFTMGDGGNDFEMIRDAGCSAVPSNANAEVKSVAKRVLDWSHEENAVGRAIDDFFFNGEEYPRFKRD
ncbi:putative Cof-type HAD-IIB family hydrolase [Blattamonas nauphoetae]|uniref:Cof-type HAD-IIB family hydrolase n=1 Tax=Blattamonas nauphoetae TaxID=2049346 RepID=A0ABQ9Y6H6_9EUKA|nr:putative Cof-type HAD-IIB family hydrolase [Blattamonas nauphoetae]